MTRVSRGRPRDITKGTPFRYPLRNEFPGRAGKLMRLAHDGRVVRVLSGWNERELCDLRSFTQGLRRDGLRVPDYAILRASRWDRAREATYVVTESIIGERLDEIAAPSDLDWLLPISHAFYKRLYDAMDEFVERLIAHYLQLMDHGGLVFNAMDQSQFLYGTTCADHHPYIYFVDLDPTFNFVPPLGGDLPQFKANERKADFEKPLNIFFEMQILHPASRFRRSSQAAKSYFARCSEVFKDFYSRDTPWWARALNFELYQRMKKELLDNL